MSPEAQAFLKEIHDRKEWQEILELISKPKVKAYQPVNRKDSSVLAPEIQEKNWIYTSGQQKHCDLVLKLLRTGESDE